MILCDANILIYAYRDDSLHHIPIKNWLEAQLSSNRSFGYNEMILSAFLRITTHPRIFKNPSPLSRAVRFAEYLRNLPWAVRINPGERHWEIFSRLCKTAKTTGNLIPDAWLAALAIESGCEWISTDRDFARFSGLSWKNPLDHMVIGVTGKTHVRHGRPDRVPNRVAKKMVIGEW